MIWDIFKTEYVEWESYKERIDFLDDLHFQQNTRAQNIRNLDAQ